MDARLSRLTIATILFALRTIGSTDATSAQPNTSPANAVKAMGTLNLVLANKNGFVIAADSRMSSETPFSCNGNTQFYCDNSQKLFRTTPSSALVIAGFAIDRENSPLDLAVASVLLRQFGPRGLANDDIAPAIPDRVRSEFSEALTNVAALAYPFDPPHHTPNQFQVTFARLQNLTPVLRQVFFKESLVLSETLHTYVPQFETYDTGDVQVTTFTRIAYGLPYVANAILDGQWRSSDPAILNYYNRKKRSELDAMPLDEMHKLVLSILKETRALLVGVGGEDQVGVFPTSGGRIEFDLPATLPAEAKLIPNILQWTGLDCANRAPSPCLNTGVSFSFDSQRAGQPYMKFFLAGQFRNIPIALEDNIFIGNDFDGVTFIWTGGKPFMRANRFANCTLEISERMPVPSIPELRSCRLARVTKVDIKDGTVGLKGSWNSGAGVAIQPWP